MPQIRKSVSFRAHQDADAAVRTETYQGREHLVVPVIALVEGVLQGMNAPDPELALAEEFGRVPAGWNGRPVVMNHPVVNGVPVSANSPLILEEYSFGQLFNTRVEDKKLKTEAWIDLEKVNTLGGEVQTTVERIQANEQVEVSTGLFAGNEPTKGKFNGKAYNAIWRGVVPDHLAFLSEGVLGACSIEDGCGTPRVNAASTQWQEYSMADNVTIKSNCSCQTHANVSEDAKEADETIETPNGVVNLSAVEAKMQTRMVANALPDGIFDNEVRSLLRAAIMDTIDKKKEYAYVWGFTTNSVVYEQWDSKADTYQMFQRTYDINAKREVTLGNEVTRVNLVTKVEPVPVSTKTLLNEGKESTTMADENGQTATPVVDNADKDKDKAKMKDEGATPATPTDENASGKVNEASASAPTPALATQSAQPAQPARMKTMSEYLADMPDEMQEVFNSGLKLHNQKKTALIDGLKASGRCKFNDDQLKNMSMDMLENLAELASVPTYEGAASPKTNASADDDAIPAMPSLFPANTTAAA